ncbi:MAG: hypothetical protein NVSMB44_20810 [Ktedonobacteraceae bacterium]
MRKDLTHFILLERRPTSSELTPAQLEGPLQIMLQRANADQSMLDEALSAVHPVAIVPVPMLACFQPPHPQPASIRSVGHDAQRSLRRSRGALR